MIPGWLSWWARIPGGPAWLERLPRLTAECAANWELELGAPFVSFAGFVTRARRAGGERVVLKVNFPEPEAEHEAAALEHYGDHAPRVLAHDPERWALLLERVDPGIALPEDEVEAVVPGLLGTIWRAPGPVIRSAC